MVFALASALALDPLIAVGGVLLLIFAGLSWLNRRLQAGGGRRPRLGRRSHSVALTGQHAVHVVELAGERWLLGTGPSGAPSLIARLDHGAEQAQAILEGSEQGRELELGGRRTPTAWASLARLLRGAAGG